MLGDIYELSVRISDSGGPVRPVVNRPPDLAAPPGGHVIVLVHGYNNDASDAKESYGDFLDNLRSLSSQADSRPRPATADLAKFLWPGDADLWIFSFLSYPSEIPDAQKSARVLAQFMTEMPGLRQVSLIGHSMGCRLVLEMLAMVARDEVLGFPNVHFLILAAAAVPVALVERGGRLHDGIVRTDPRVLVLFSPDDLVLRFAFPAGQSLAYTMGHEDGIYFSAVGLNGNPRSLAASRKQLFGGGHSDYWKSDLIAQETLALLGFAVSHGISSHATPAQEAAEHRLPDAHSPLGSRPER